MRLVNGLIILAMFGASCGIGMAQENPDKAPPPDPEKEKANEAKEEGPDPEKLKEFEAKVQKQIAERIVKEAQEKIAVAGPRAKHIMVVVEMIEVEHDDFSEWLQENPLRTEATELRQAVQTWVKAKRAKIRETMVVASRSGQRAKTEGIDEVIYPTNFTPPSLPANVTLNGEAKVPKSPATPGAFETRNVGVTLEVDPVMGQNGEIDLNLAPELIFHVEDRVVHSADGDVTAEVSVPVFHTVKVTTQVTLVSGGYAFLGTSRLHETQESDNIDDSLVLIFVRADAL